MKALRPGAGRTRFEAIICCDADESRLINAGKAIIEPLSKLFGGASAQSISGGWAIDGNKHEGPYRGISLEPGIKVVLSVPDEDASFGYQSLQRIIADVIIKHDLPARFIHVDRLYAEALHFDLTTLEYCSGDGAIPAAV